MKSNKSTLFILWGCVLLTAILCWIDMVTPLGFAGGVPYVFVVLATIWLPGRSYSFFFGLVSVFLVVAGYLLSPAGGTQWIVLANRAMASFAIVMTGILVIGQKENRLLLERLVSEKAEVLSDSTQRFRTSFDNAAIGKALVAPDGGWIEVNRALCNLLGYDAEALCKLTFQDITHPDDLDADLAFVQQMLLGEMETYQMEKRYYHRDGSIVWVLLSVSAVRDDEGTVEYFISQLQDITEQQKAKEALHESEARNAAILEASQDSIISIDEDTRIIDFNPAAEVTFGYTAEDVIGKSITDLIIPPRLREAHRKGMARYKLTGNSKMLNKRVRLTAVRANGIEFPIEMVVQPIEMNRRTLFTAYLRDITERDAFEKALIEAKDNAEETSHLKSSFLNNISHEIRTPLTAIIGFSSILESEVEEEQREMVGLIEHSGKRLLNTLNTVLDLSMLEAGTLNLEREWIRMEDMVQEKINVFKPVALDKQVDFILDNTLGEAEGYLDRTCMGRVLDHLLDNAIKFTEKGSIRVALSIDDEMLVLSIADTGVGIDRSFQPHLYDEFKQESAGTTRSYEGTGLGLNITKRMVDLMGGTIMVQSEKGKGSTFALWFPMSLVRMPSDRLASSPSMPSAERQKRRILAVEDSMEIEVLLTYILQENYYVDVVKNETALLEKVQDTSYDLVLMDINLGTRRTGIDVMQSLREMPAYASVPIIAMTAYALLEDRDRFLEVGFDGYISKPFTTKELLDIIEQMLETGIRKRLPTFPVNSARA